MTEQAIVNVLLERYFRHLVDLGPKLEAAREHRSAEYLQLRAILDRFAALVEQSGITETEIHLLAFLRASAEIVREQAR